MRIFYSPETDSLNIKFRVGGDEVVGEIMGEELGESVVVHRDDAGKLYELELLGSASKLADLSLLEVEGLPISVTRESPQESRTS